MVAEMPASKVRTCLPLINSRQPGTDYDSRMRIFRSSWRRRNCPVHWLLVLALLAQSALPLQAHTVLASDGAGQLVVICTWNGTRTERLQGQGDDPGATVERLSPACLFSQLLAAADLSPGITLPASVTIRPVTIVEHESPPRATAPARAHSIRAPPQGLAFS